MLSIKWFLWATNEKKRTCNLLENSEKISRIEHFNRISKIVSVLKLWFRREFLIDSCMKVIWLMQMSMSLHRCTRLLLSTSRSSLLRSLPSREYAATAPTENTTDPSKVRNNNRNYLVNLSRSRKRTQWTIECSRCSKLPNRRWASWNCWSFCKNNSHQSNQSTVEFYYQYQLRSWIR